MKNRNVFILGLTVVWLVIAFCALGPALVKTLPKIVQPGSSLHELKIMSPDGKDYWVLMQNQDISDIGIGCGK
jgi:hypothetical protein